MEQVIDEKKLIEILEDWKFKNEEKGYDTAKDLVQEMIYIVNEQPKTDWIPCEERLPSEQNQYLVSLEGYCKPMIAYFSTENKKWYWYNSTSEMRYVIAWQPLPQPYKKEGAE